VHVSGHVSRARVQVRVVRRVDGRVGHPDE